MRWILILFLIFSSSVYGADLKLTMFKVWHGDLMLLQLPNGKNMVIDTGHRKKSKKFLFPELEKLKIKTIDYLVLTHPDSDHIGGAAELLRSFKVKQVWESYYQKDKEDYRNLQRILTFGKYDVKQYKEGDVVFLDNIKITFFNPKRKKSKSNNASLVFKLEYKDFSILFAGDLQRSGQKRLYKRYGSQLESTVYKVAHHGEFSYSKFLYAVNPDAAMCPCLYTLPGWFPGWNTVRILRKLGKFHSVRGGNLRLVTDGYDFSITKD